VRREGGGQTIMIAKPAPILLTGEQVRELLDHGQIELRFRLPRPRGIPPHEDTAAGDRFWVRESFSAREDGHQLKIRYPADGAGGRPRFLPIDQVPPRYRSRQYFTRPARHCPQWASRSTVEVVAAAVEPPPAGVLVPGCVEAFLVIRAQLLPAAETQSNPGESEG
jgi:hypothetical protein